MTAPALHIASHVAPLFCVLGPLEVLRAMEYGGVYVAAGELENSGRCCTRDS